MELITTLLLLWSQLRDKLWPPVATIPEPGLLLKLLLRLMYRRDTLKKLEILSQYFFQFGLFRFENKVYLLNYKYCQTVITKLDKGSAEYLANSPLNNSFLASSKKCPDTRRAIAAIFRKSNMEEKGLTMIKDIEKMIKQIKSNAKVNVNDVSLRLALDIVGHELLGVNLHALDGAHTRLIDAMMTILHKAYALGEITFESQEFQNQREIFDEITSRILKNALDCVDHESGFKTLPCLLQKSCGFDQAKDNLKLFLMAGSETIAAALPVFLHTVASRDDIQKLLQKESDIYIDHLRKDPGTVPPLLESAMKEILRLYPTAPFISRHARTEISLGGVIIPENTDLRVFMWGIHRSPFLWENSKFFNPRRFERRNSSSTSNQSFSWIPFGAGSRICIGQHLAWVELRLTLTFLFHHFSFSPVLETPELRFCVDWEHAVVHPDKDIILGIKARERENGTLW